MVCAALAVVTTATTFAPWASSGDRVRTSYAVVDVVERAGVLTSSSATVSVVWYFVPALCGVVLVCASLGRVVIAGGSAVTLGALVAAGGVLVARSPLGTEPGATVGVLTGVCTALAGVAALVTITERRER